LPIITIIILVVILVILAIAAFVSLGGMRTRGQLERALNMTLFLVRLPREALKQEGIQPKQEKEWVSVFEQLLSGFSNIHATGWNKFIYGEPYVSLELAVHHSGEEIHFYIAVPRSSEKTIEKQINGIFPTADVSHSRDYNIFNPDGADAAAYVTFEGPQILPFRTYQQLETDPLSSIVTSMSQLETEGEGAAMQILLRPTHSDTKSLAQLAVREMKNGYKLDEALRRIKYPPKQAASKEEENKKQEERMKQVTPGDGDIIKAIEVKSAKQLFDVNIRFIASAHDKKRAEQILDGTLASLAQFSTANINSLKSWKLKGRAFKEFIYNYSFRLFDKTRTVVMSTEEITSLYHLPTGLSLLPRVKYLKSKPAEAPHGLPVSGIMLGRNIFRGGETIVRMSEEDRRRHLYVLGQTGTGKTTLMKAMIRQDIESGKGVCVVDPHGDFAEFALSIIPDDRKDDVIYFNPGDVDMPMGLNMLEIDPKHPEQKTTVVNELFGIIDKLYNLKETGGPMFEKYFKNAVLLLLDNYEYEIPTLADISRVLVNPKFRAEKLAKETNPLVKEFWELEAEKAGGEAALANMAPYISSKVDTFVSNEFLRPIINQKNSAFNFKEVMNDGKILIANLSKGRIGDLNANLLGMIITGKLLMAALARGDMPEGQRKDFYLYMDEFQNFTTDSIGTILSEARKYRLNLIIAHQFIKQLREDIKDAVFGNVGSIAVFRIGADDAEFMKNKFEPVFGAHDLMNIDNLNAYLNLLVNGQTTTPFNIIIDTGGVFGEGSSDKAEEIIKYSREKYGRPREQVEQEIRKSRIIV